MRSPRFAYSNAAPHAAGINAPRGVHTYIIRKASAPRRGQVPSRYMRLLTFATVSIWRVCEKCVLLALLLRLIQCLLCLELLELSLHRRILVGELAYGKSLSLVVS